MFALFAACSMEQLPKPEMAETNPEYTSSQVPEPTTTAETGTAPTIEWNGLYPLVPYDCAGGVPAGPLTGTVVPDVITTEDFAIDTDGRLVASDLDGNLLRYTAQGSVSVFVPDAGDTRGIEVLLDGNVVITNGGLSTLISVDTAGTLTTITPIGSAPAGIDVAADGTLYVADISTGGIYEILPDGTITNLGPIETGVSHSTYGVALSVDESTLYVSLNSSDAVYRLQRGPTGLWGQPEPWVTVSGFALGGMAVDACDNLYVISTFGCNVSRVTPAGATELLAELDLFGYCPGLGFGRDVGGWDPLVLYATTYGTLVALEVGVPGKPR